VAPASTAKTSAANALAQRVPRPSPQQLQEQRLRELERSLQDAERHVSRIRLRAGGFNLFSAAAPTTVEMHL
jgi:hypothetical protein